VEAVNKMQVEMDLCTIYLIEAKNCEADAPDMNLKNYGRSGAQI